MEKKISNQKKEEEIYYQENNEFEEGTKNTSYHGNPSDFNLSKSKYNKKEVPVKNLTELLGNKETKIKQIKKKKEFEVDEKVEIKKR